MAKKESPPVGQEITATVLVVGGTVLLATILSLTDTPESLTLTQPIPSWAEPGTVLPLEQCEGGQQTEPEKSLRVSRGSLEATFGTAGVPQSIHHSEVVPLMDGSSLIERTHLLVGMKTSPFGPDILNITRIGMGFEFTKPLGPDELKEPWGSSAMNLLSRTDLLFPEGAGNENEPSPVLTMQYAVGADINNIQAVQGGFKLEGGQKLCFQPNAKVRGRELDIRLEQARLSKARLQATVVAEEKTKRAPIRKKDNVLQAPTTTTVAETPTSRQSSGVVVLPTNRPTKEAPTRRSASATEDSSGSVVVAQSKKAYDLGSKFVNGVWQSFWSSDLARTAGAAVLGGLGIGYALRGAINKGGRVTSRAPRV